MLTLTPLLSAFVFLFGTIIGSFINAVLWRLHAEESIVHGRSHCVHCGHSLSAADLVPVLSWLSLRGKCRYCSKPIGASYVIIELVVGLLFLLAARTVILGHAGLISPEVMMRLLLDWYLLGTLAVVFVFDLRHMLILRSVVMPATVLALAGGVALGARPADLAIGMIIGGGVFWLQYVVSRGAWIGGGDITLGILMGAMLGWEKTLGALLLAYVSGALVGVVLLGMKRKGWKSELPFGTFLSVAAGMMLLYGDRLIGWYLGLL